MSSLLDFLVRIALVLVPPYVAGRVMYGGKGDERAPPGELETVLSGRATRHKREEAHGAYE